MFYIEEEINNINNSYKPNDETIIARYMNLAKFLDLLENEELHFTSSKFFEDGLEGKVPESYYNGWKKEYRNRHSNIVEKFKEVQNIYLNCWNKFEAECYALWKIYTIPEYGICIRSTVGKLKKALSNPNIEIYKVKYIDSYTEKTNKTEPPFYSKNNIPNIQRVMEALKFKPYKYENEIRAVYIDYSKDKFKRFQVDINELIECIYISPFSPQWYFELVKKIVKNTYKHKINSNIEIKKSEILINDKKI